MPARTRRMGLTFAGAGMVLVLLATTVFASSTRAPAPHQPEPSPSASPSPADRIIYGSSLEISFEPWAPESPLIPGPSLSLEPEASWTPDATPPIEPGAQRPRTVFKVTCIGFQDQGSPTVSNSIIYATCGYPQNDGLKTVAIDAATGKIKRTYNIAVDPYGFTGQPLEISGGLWLSNPLPGHCAGPECPDDPNVYRVDATSGKTTFKIKGWRVADEGLGYIWAVGGTGKTILKIDPTTTKTSTISWNHGEPVVACGSLWGLSRAGEPEDSDETTTITRVDPESGAVLARFTETGLVYSLGEVSGSCVAVEELKPAQAVDAGPSPGPWRYGHVARLITLGPDGVLERSPLFSEAIVLVGQNVWLTHQACLPGSWACASYFQRLDLASYQPTGELWLMPNDLLFFYSGWFFEVGGWIWIYDGEQSLIRTAIPADAPHPTTTAEPSGSPSAEPSGAPSATPAPEPSA